jgi:hypothetical protein
MVNFMNIEVFIFCCVCVFGEAILVQRKDEISSSLIGEPGHHVDDNTQNGAVFAVEICLCEKDVGILSLTL